MEPRIEPKSKAERRELESKLTSVCEHYEPEAQSEYDTVQGRLLAIVTILENRRVEPDERWKVKSLGAVVVGEA